ncbi:ICAM5 protein, partial [Tyrannus savana]|nr:ICAM5 protein [Tyrannus savana]
TKLGDPQGPPRVPPTVSRAHAGTYQCRASNAHGSAVRNVTVAVEYQPSIPERGCPERRLWLEGTPARLGCAATGNPPPRVTCAKLGDSSHHPLVTPNVTWTELGDSQDHPLGPPRVPPTVSRAHAGTYQCRASNAHGSAVRNVTVAVECESPGGGTLRGGIDHFKTLGGRERVIVADCGRFCLIGVPAPAFAWAVPPAPNLRLGPDNRSVTVTAATAANRGLYTCTASNRHGRGARSVLVSVDGAW